MIKKIFIKNQNKNINVHFQNSKNNNGVKIWKYSNRNLFFFFLKDLSGESPKLREEEAKEQIEGGRERESEERRWSGAPVSVVPH